MFAQRVVGLQAGKIVYDGLPDGLTPDVLTQIYGEEDWLAADREYAPTGNNLAKSELQDQDRLAGEG